MTLDVPARTRIAAVPALAGLAVVAQIAYPLTDGNARDDLTTVIVVLFAATSLVHAYVTRGRPALVVLLGCTVVFGFAVEVVGVHTGVPFGHYGYAGSLGPRLLGVPIVVALCWTMLAWPAALAARILARTFAGRVAVGTWALASWDLFLDPQMVGAGHWRWADPEPHLPGVATVPLSNFAGWLFVAAVMSFMIQCTLARSPSGDDRVPLALYVWTWASSTLALAAFLDLPAAAAWGSVGMGIVAVPVLRRLVPRSG